MGSTLYNLLSYLSFPKALESLKYDEIVDLLLKHLNQAANKICEKRKFRKRFQLENELI